MECGDSHTDRAEDGGLGGEMVRKARWRQERLVQRFSPKSPCDKNV